MIEKLSHGQRIEKEYHDKKYKDWAVPAGYDSGIDKANDFYWGLFGDVAGLDTLDLCCGNEWLSMLLAKRGAKVWGIDISEELIKTATKAAEKAGLSDSITFRYMTCEEMSFDDNSFDLILGSAILHDTDLALRNIHRVLRSVGRAVFIEPLK